MKTLCHRVWKSVKLHYETMQLHFSNMYLANLAYRRKAYMTRTENRPSHVNTTVDGNR